MSEPTQPEPRPGPFARLMYRWAVVSHEREARPPDRPLMVFVLLSLVVVCTSAVVSALDLGIWSGLARLVLAGAAGTAIAAPLGRRLAYRHGYMEGRIALLRSMAEAQHRGMSARQWVEAEAERDVAVMLGVRWPPR